MLEGLIEKLILSYFGDFIENLDKNKLSVGIWSGSLSLEDIIIRAKKINELKFPFRLVFGRIGKLSMNIPWKSNFTVPTVINIDGVQVLLSLIKQEEWEFLDYISYEAKIQYLMRFANERISELIDAFAPKDQKSSGYVDRVIVKVLDNLHVNFKNINIRIEEPNKTPNYSLGITLQEMLVVNTNENWEQQFIDRNVNKNVNIYKLLKISNFGLYLRVNETQLISLFPKTQLLDEMTAFFPLDAPEATNMDYLIRPISLIAKMKQNNEINSSIDCISTSSNSLARVNLYINLETFDIDFQKNQFDCLIRILNHISNYQKFQFNYYETRKYFFFKPKYKIFDQTTPKILASTYINNENAVLWFQFAIKMVLKKIKYNRGQINIFDLPSLAYSSFQTIFAEIFFKFLKDQNSLTTEEKVKLREIIELVEIQDLYLWSKPVIQEIYKEQKKQENIKAKTGFLKKVFGGKTSDADILSKEDEEKIEEILENAVKEATYQIINEDIETKIRIDFTLSEGSFKFSKSVTTQNANMIEGFGCKYKNLFFSMRKGEYFTEIESQLKEFNIGMFTIVNKNAIHIPITFKSMQEEIKRNSLIRLDTIDLGGREDSNSDTTSMSGMILLEDDYVWKVKFIKNGPNDEINSKLFLSVNTLNITYHQVLIDRIVTFFKVNLNEELATKAWDKISDFKESTQQTIKEAMKKKNIIELQIEPRKVIIPINKYDIKNSRILVIELGRISMHTSDQSEYGDVKYKERYNLDISTISLSHFNSYNKMRMNRNRFEILTDVSGSLGFALLNTGYSSDEYAAFKLFVDINNVTVHTNEYLYTTFMYIIDIFKPTREADLWSQLHSDKDEIKKNAKVFAKVLKKNQTYLNWEEYYAVLSSGYIYFYKSIDDEEYMGYYYVKDSVITQSTEEPMCIKLQNKYGSIEIKYQNENKLKQWINCLTERINEMKKSYEDKAEEIVQDLARKHINPSEIYFGLEINLKQVTGYLYTGSIDGNYDKIFTISIQALYLELKLRDLDTSIALSIQGIKVFDELCEIKEFKQILDSEDQSDKDTKLVSLNIVVCDDNSPKYKGIQIDIEINIGYMYAIWNPLVIRRLLAFVAHNDILRNKIIREINIPTEKLLDENFIDPGKEDVIQKPICTVSKYTYIKLQTQFKKVSIVWIQPVLNIMFLELRLGQSSLNLDMKVDHFYISGELGNTQIFDLTQYPFTIRTQQEYNPLKIKEIFGAKQNYTSLISFGYKSLSTWCPLCKNNYTSEANVKINSIFLIYIQEHFLRFFNYLMGEFLGALGPSEEVKKFRDEKNQEKKKQETEIDFLRLNVVISNPQIILKPRVNFKEYFLVDLGKVTLTCAYCKVFKKVRACPEEWRWNTTYQFNIKNCYITTHDNFHLCSPTDGLVNMHFTSITESDKDLSELEYDSSFQIDLFFHSFNLNLRQRDFTYLMQCLDLNILYTDEQEDDYNYEAKLKPARTVSKKDVVVKDPEERPSTKKKEELMGKYISMFVVLFTPQISLRLYLHEEPFTELILQEMQLNFSRKLNFTKEVCIVVADMEIYHIVDFAKKQIILSDFTQLIHEYENEADLACYDNTPNISARSNSVNYKYRSMSRDSVVIDENLIEIDKVKLSPFSENLLCEFQACVIQKSKLTESPKIQADIRIAIDANREKTYFIYLYGLKLVTRLDTIQLIKNFFLEGFPYYDKSLKDLPNLYDPNEENNPGMKLLVEIKKPLICFLSDNILNKDQDLLCISSDVVVGLRKEKVSKIKNELFSNYTELTNLKLFIQDEAQKDRLDNEIINDKSSTYTLNVSFLEVCPFICNMKDVLFSKELIISKRKIMENFVFTYESKVQMQYVPPNNYVLTTDNRLDCQKITIKASYRDLVLFLRVSDYNSQLMSKEYEDKFNSLMHWSRVKKEYEEMSKKEQEMLKRKEMMQSALLSGSTPKINDFAKRLSMKARMLTIAELDEIPDDTEEIDENVKMNIVNDNYTHEVKPSSFEKYKPKDMIIDKGMGNTIILTHGIQLILIDDHANTFYPFFSLLVHDFSMKNDINNFMQSVMTANILAKILTYNYIAGTWEPLVEKTSVNIEITQDTSDEKVHCTAITIRIPVMNPKSQRWLNINISDLTLCFLYSTLSNWIDKYFKLKNNYSEEVKKIILSEKTMNITNHTIFNYTGRPIYLMRKYSNQKKEHYHTKLGEIRENQSIEIDYFGEKKDLDFSDTVMQNLLKENYISFKFKDAEIYDHTMKIDNMQTKTHFVNYESIKRIVTIPKDLNRFEYIVSQIDFHKLKKFIYFYSPLAFKNKTQHNLIVSLVNKPLSNLFMFFNSKDTIGIPFEYLNGTIEFQLEGSVPQSFPIKKFLMNNTIVEEINFDNVYISFYHRPMDNVRNKVIRISTSYCIRNCLPFDIQVVLMKTKEMLQIPKGEKVFTDSISIHENLVISLFFLTFRSESNVVLYHYKNPQMSTSIKMMDDQNNPVIIFSSVTDTDQRTVVLHANGVIINHTLMDMKFYYGKQKKSPIEVAGQKDIANIFLLSDEKYLFLEFKGYKSDPVNISAIGTSTVVECRKKEKVVEFIMECNLSLLSQDLFLYSNIITFVPRFIIFNQLSIPVLVCLFEEGQDSQLIRSCEKKPFYFFGKGCQSLVCFRPMEQGDDIEYESGSKWDWSCPLSILSSALITLKVTGLDKKQKRFINLEKKLDTLSTYIIIKDTNYENCQIVVKNRSFNISCKVWQETYEDSCEYVDTRSQIMFTWSNSGKNSILCIQFYIGELGKRPFCVQHSIGKYEIMEDRAIFLHTDFQVVQMYPCTDIFALKTSMYRGHTFKVQILTDGSRISVIINDITNEVNRISGNLTSIVEVKVLVEKMGISLIGDNKYLECKKNMDKYRRSEIVYITLSNIMFYSKRQTIDKVSHDEMQLKIMEAEIDNQHSYITQFPVILRPVNSNKNLPKNQTNAALAFPAFFNCAIFLQKTENEETTKILLFNYLIQSFILGLDSNVLVALMNFVQNVTIGMKTSLTYINPVFISHMKNLDKGLFIKDNYYDPTLLQKILINEKPKLFIQRMQTSSMEILLSFINQSKDQMFQRLLESNRILSGVLSTISNVENVPLMLNGTELHNFYGEWTELITHILYIYRQNALIQVMKLFGAIDILGNPLNLLNSIGTGFKDFFQKPAKGMIHGPLEGAKGVLEGSLSLVKHTVDGTFNTTSKITSGISKGILMITQDDEYINEREQKKITEKPKNFVEGIGYGLSSMAGGIFYGVTDIVRKPIEGAKKEKWKGFGKGMLKGIGGVIAKPISGILDMVSKTTEGIKNTVNDDDVFKAERLPRPFYGKYKFIKSYNIYHAQVIELLNNKIEHFKSHSIDFYSSEIYQNRKEENVLIVFSTTSIFAIDILRRELKSVLFYTDIKDVIMEGNDKIRINFNKEINRKTSTSISFSKHNSNPKVILNKIKEAIENNYEEKFSLK